MQIFSISTHGSLHKHVLLGNCTICQYASGNQPLLHTYRWYCFDYLPRWRQKPVTLTCHLWGITLYREWQLWLSLKT